MGDNPESGILVQKANSMGIQTVVVGINRDTLPKRIAWHSHDVNALDIDALETIAHKEGVNGVMVGVADILVPSYCEICNRLGLPCYASPNAVKYLSDKSAFKQQLAQVGLPVIPEYQKTQAFLGGKYPQLTYPLVVKPVDSGGSMGITIVSTPEELPAAVEKAPQASHSHRIQLEKYMQGDIVACYYTLIDGQVFLSSIEDNLFTHKQTGRCPVTTGHFYASRYYTLYKELMCEIL